MYIERFKKKLKNKGIPFVKKSLRQLNIEWRQSITIKVNKHKNVTIIVDSLFDIGKNMGSLTGDEAYFYTDQLTSR